MKSLLDNMIGGLAGFLMIGVWVLAIAGWFMNIYQLINYNYSTGELVVKGAGIIIAPLGAIMGWV